MWALALTLAAALPPLTDVARPDGAVKAALAQVIVSKGVVTISAVSGKPFDARSGMQLAATDTITVGPGAWVALALIENGHMVRLDDDLSLRVDQLALLKAPKPNASLKQQFDKLVTEKEQDSAGRLIGWNASQTGANVPSSLEAISKTGGSSTRNAPKASIRDEMDSAPSPPGEKTEPEPAPPPPGRPSPPKPPSPTSLVADPALTTCVANTLEPLGADVKKLLSGKVVVRAKLRADGTMLVQLPLGLNTPACAVSWFFGKPGLGPKWSEVTVNVP